MMIDYPRLWCIICISTNTVEYSNTRYTAVKGFFNGIPESIRGQFELVRYDANINYKPTKEDN